MLMNILNDPHVGRFTNCYVKFAFVVPKLCLPVPELCINWSWSRDSCAGGKSPSNRRKNNDAKDSSKPGFSTILKIEIKWMIEMIWTYNKNETHDRNFTNNRNDPNDGNKTNQTNNANIFTSWTKPLCLTLKFEPKLWFINMNVTLANHFYLWLCWPSVKNTYSTWICNSCAPRFWRLLSPNFNSNGKDVKNFKLVHSCFYRQFPVWCFHFVFKWK